MLTGIDDKGLAQFTHPHFRELLYHVGYAIPLHPSPLRTKQFALWKADDAAGRSLAAIVFMAQWHPVIKPSNSKLRPQFVHDS